MKVSVIIPTFDRKETLGVTLLSLDKQSFKDFEVIVADDGSSDGTAEMVKGLALSLSYPIRHVWQQNAGRSAARNMGLETAAGEIILFIDDHIILDRALIEEHVKYHDKYGKSGVKVVRGQVHFIEVPQDAPKETRYADTSKYKPPYYEQEPFRIFITNNISVEKRALLSVFGFDEDFKEYGLQDAEMGYRLKSAGYKFKINPNAVGYIFGVGWTFEERLKRRRQVGRSSVLFTKKHPSLLVKMNLSVHWLTLLVQKLLSRFETKLPKRMLMFYNLALGIKEGREKYAEPRFKMMHSRFKGGRKTILFVSHISDLSGAPISLSLLVKHLNAGKYHCIIALPSQGPITKRLDDWDINYQIYKDSPLHSIFPSMKVRQMIKERGVDLVYLNTSASIWAAKAAKLQKVPVISHIREDLRGPNFHVLRGKIINWSDRIILISNWMRTFIRADKTTVVHNTVDLAAFEGLRPDRIRREFTIKGPSLAYVGSLEERKGVKHLVKAFPKIKTSFPFLKLLIAGSTLPGQKNYLDHLKKQTRDPNMVFLGARSDVYDIMAAVDIVIVPSISEPFGRVVIEAMACGKPVIASRVGGIPEIVEDGKTGILVPPGKLDAIAKEVTLLLKNREKMASMGAFGKERVKSLFNIDGQIKKIEAVIDELIK